MGKYNISFRCYFPGKDNHCDHRADIPVEEIPKWIEAYLYTHPACKGVSVRVYVNKEEGMENG